MSFYEMQEALLIEKICSQTNQTEREVMEKVDRLREKHHGFLTRKGAMVLLLHLMGVKPGQEEKELKIKDIRPGQTNVTTYGKVLTNYGISTFEQEDGEKGEVGSLLIGDETGTLRVVLWHEKAEALNTISEEDIVRITKGHVRLNNNRTELHTNGKSAVQINPFGLHIRTVKRYQATRKKISELADKEESIELAGTLVNIYPPSFYDICPECRKRVEGGNCEDHGHVAAEETFRLSLVLDDGSDNMRLICFSKQAEKLLKRTREEMLQLKDQYEFQSVAHHYLGMMIKVVGRTRRNPLTEKIEFIPQLVYPDHEPEKAGTSVEEISLEDPEEETI